MSDAPDNRSEWQRQWLEAQRLQFEAYGQWMAGIHALLEARRRSLEAADKLLQAQMRWLTLWGM